MLTESDLQTPEWLAVIASGQCVVIRGHVGEHRLEGLKAILPLGAFQWATLELPQGEALDPEFFASILPAILGEVPRKIYVLPLVASTVQVDALAEVRASQPWLQWIAVVPDPEINPVLPGGVVLFDTKTRSFAPGTLIPAATKAWADKVLGGARSEEEKRRVVASEGPKILATINAVSAGEYHPLPGILGQSDAGYVSQLVTIASTIAGVEGIDPEAIAAEIEESASIENTINQSQLASETRDNEDEQASKPAGESQNTPPDELADEPAPSKLSPSPPASHHTKSASQPQIFENGKALPMYPPGDPVGKYASELDAVRRDPEAHEALLEVLQEFPCEGDDGHPRACAERCNDPAQKWACMRDNAWASGMPSAIVDHWLEVFAIHVARVGRKAREAYQSFSNIVLQASAANPTFSAADFGHMVQRGAVPVNTPPEIPPVKPLKSSAPSSPLKPVSSAGPKQNASFPLSLRSQTPPPAPESRAQKVVARLDSLAGRIERLKGRLNPAAADAGTPQPANDPLPGTSAGSSWEADDLGNENLSFDALEKRVARLAHGK